MEKVYTVPEAAVYLKVSEARVRSLIRENRIFAEKHGRDYQILVAEIERFKETGRKKVGRPVDKRCASETFTQPEGPSMNVSESPVQLESGSIICGDSLKILPTLPADHFQAIIADPPYFKVLLEHDWDNIWEDQNAYLEWTEEWAQLCKRVLRPDGLFYIFGQLGKREHVWLHLCSRLTNIFQFHDMIIWDRAVGYNERYDSFTPQYEMVLVLRHKECEKPFFDKDAVRIPYDEETIQMYLRDKRYKDIEAREKHLRKGKYATNIIRVPSLKGSSKEKIGHPSQKPVALINKLISASSRKGDSILDPFLGSGTTAACADALGRKWVGIETSPDYIEIARNRILEKQMNPEFSLY